MKGHQLLVIVRTFLLFCLYSFNSIEAQIDPKSNEFEIAIDSIFTDQSEMTSPGASVIILKENEVILSKSYGAANLAFGMPFNENTRFPLPNFTEQLVAFSVIQLENKGLIKLSDPVNRYLPEFEFPNDLLISHLLNHTSDLPFIASLRLMAGWKFTDPFSHNDFLQLTKKFTKDLEPDTEIGHSHEGIKILQMLVEQVAGIAFSEYATSNIFRPLGMTNSIISHEHFKENKNTSIGYTQSDTGFKRTYPTEFGIMCPTTYSTRRDFTKWMLNIQTKKYEGSIIEKLDHALSLNGASQERSNGSYCIGQQQYYKYLDQDEFYFIESNEGHSWRWRRLQQSGLSVMVTGNMNSSLRAEVNAIITLLLPQSTQTSNTEEPKPTPAKMSLNDMEACTGTYWNEEYFYTTTIRVQDGELYHSDQDNGFNFPLDPRSKTFFITPFGGSIEFTNIGGNQKKMKNILPNGSVFNSKQYDVSSLKEGDQTKYVGVYGSDQLNAIYAIVWEDQQLKLKRSRKADLVLSPIGDNRFRTSEIDFRVVAFEASEKGAIKQMNISNNGVKNVPFRKL